MSELTNTPKREPSYGKAAERYNALAKLGERVLELMRSARPGAWRWQVHAGAAHAAAALGLLHDNEQAAESRQGVETPGDGEGRSPLVPHLGDRPAGRDSADSLSPRTGGAA